MILTASFPSADTPPAITLAHYRALITGVAHAGLDAALFVRSPGPATPMLDGAPLIAALASVPVGIGLGASVPLDHTEPFHLARAFAAIDRLTGGRSAVIVDLTAGVERAAQFGHVAPPDDPDARAVECLETTAKLWDSWEDDAILVDRPGGLFTNPDRIHRINHEGMYFTVRGPLNAPRPLQGWPVIIVPVASAESRSFAAQFADVALIAPTTRDAAQSACAAIREQVAGHGRRLQAIRILVDLVPILGATTAEAQRRADAIGQHGSALQFVGTPSQLRTMMREWDAVGACDGFNLLPHDPPVDFGLLATLPHTPDAAGMTLRDRLRLPRPVNRYAA
ncbi:MAG: LLM class flavin-dependent oxidoreductase [Acetobacteraceae bacterium]|nr:LLM class flavin-dependent oxidoreductase [Acetobacteraceae bacterium]